MRMAVITIRRHLGSDTDEIGHLLAGLLECPSVPHEFLDRARTKA